MMWGRKDRGPRKATFFGRLARDVRGNTLAIMAISFIPLAGMIGSGLDLSRMYLTKTRLQHACDAGALAGRKQMGSGQWNASSLNSADQFFAANYQTGAYGSLNLTHQFTQNAGKVSGTASADLPMTLTRVIGATTQTLTVTCETDMRLPNTDIMFVLDTTGSMAQPAVVTDTDTKIVALRKAVKCFYETVARLDTDATCVAGAPSGGTGNQVQIRFGFMPYSTNVNVGKLLPTSYFADSWTYQSRRANFTNTTNTTYPTYYDSAPVTTANDNTFSAWSNVSSQFILCPAIPNPNPQTSASSTTTTDSTPTLTNGSMVYTTTTTTGTVTTQYRTGYSGLTCYLQQSTRNNGSKTVVTHTAPPVTTTTRVFKDWHYGAIPLTLTGLKSGTSWNNGFILPLGASGTDRVIGWDGCIEERVNDDLDIDAVPTPGDVNSVWAPALNDVIYTRNVTGTINTANAVNLTRTESDNPNDYGNNVSYFCPTEAKKLQPWTDANAFDDYVDSLQPSGNTYHDIGMVWGARFLSPDGIFSAENRLTPSGGTIERNLIFMTDGDAQASPCDYAAHGIAWFDQRTSANVGTNALCPYASTALADEINTRLVTLCTAIKNKNITLWVISFGSGSNTTTETRLSNCATPGRYFVARDSATLQQTFANIANQISQLRLTS